MKCLVLLKKNNAGAAICLKPNWDLNKKRLSTLLGFNVHALKAVFATLTRYKKKKLNGKINVVWILSCLYQDDL